MTSAATTAAKQRTYGAGRGTVAGKTRHHGIGKARSGQQFEKALGLQGAGHAVGPGFPARVAGVRGAGRIPHHIGDLQLALPEKEHETSHLWPAPKMSLGHFIDAHTACIYDFLNCINDGTLSMLNFDDAVLSQEILEAGYISARQNGATVTLPLP